MDELYPRVLRPGRARQGSYDIGLNIDAEEADRLELSLDLLEKLCFEPVAGGLERHRLRHPGLWKRCPAS
jgi:RHH-type proline utilization regulon transcriptional repressor/proline dehydrogenase/delta 1-pyrroline-5-carboxylate dehydrogenase